VRRLLFLLLVACTPLEPETTMNRYTLAAASVAGFWSATGGTITPTGLYTADTVPGAYWVAFDSAGLHDTAEVRVCGAEQTLTLDDDYEELAIAGTHDLTATITSTCSDTLTELVTWTSRNAAIASVASTGDLTATVTAVDTGYTYIVASAASVVPRDSILICVLHGLGIDVSPATLSVAPTTAGTLTATVTRCGTAVDSAVTWVSRTPAVATVTTPGATTTVTGVTAGTSWVVADEGSTGVKDSALVTVGSQVTYFLADAESGTITPPFVSWGTYALGGGIAPVTTTDQAKNGTRSFKFEVTNPAAPNFSSSTVSANVPNVTSMGCSRGHFCTGWYSFYVYVDTGYTHSAWNPLLNFQASDPVRGSDPVGHVNLNIRNGVLQLYWNMKNCQVGRYVCPNITGYQNNNGDYYMTASSPSGIEAVPRNQWVHMSVYYEMSRTNGKVHIWQDGVLIMQLTAPTFNTLDGNQTYNNTGGDLSVLGLGIYHGPNADLVRRIYVDDFRVSNYRPTP
jgi:hypothetical protein